MKHDVREVELDNGFRALLMERHALPVVASIVWYQVGSRDERTGETGLSHFLEHMMFKGTDCYAKGEIDLLTSKMGGANNAFTDSDVTAYHFALASDRWETALEIEANRMRNCSLDESEFEAEKSVVLEELAMGEDDPWRSLLQAAETLTYQVHPYHHPVIGWREDLERLDVATMRDYYRRHYGPNRAFLVVVGDFDAGRTARRVKDLFGPIPPEAVARERPLQEPEPRGERRATIRFPGGISRMALTVKTCRMGERDDFVLDVIAFVLASDKSSRLHRRLVLEEQLATTVSVYNDVKQDPGLLWVTMELQEGADPGAAERVLEEELERLMTRNVTAAELRRARTQLRASYMFEEETVLDLAMRIGRFEAMTREGWRLLDKVLDTYDSVTAGEVREVAARYLRPSRRNIVWSLPEVGARSSGGRR